MQFKLNERVLEFEPRRIMDVADLKRRMANGSLLYWTMVKPAHAVLYDPATDKVAQLTFFSKLWGLQRGKQIRHDRYDGIYQVFVPTSPALEKRRESQKSVDESETLFAHSSNPLPVAKAVEPECVSFEPYI